MIFHAHYPIFKCFNPSCIIQANVSEILLKIRCHDVRGKMFFFRCFPTYFCEKPSTNIEILKALSHGAIFLATCNAILLLRDVNLCQMFGMLKIHLQTRWKLVFANFISPKSRTALQIARKIAPCDRALRACGYKISLHVMVTGLMN